MGMKATGYITFASVLTLAVVVTTAGCSKRNDSPSSNSGKGSSQEISQLLQGYWMLAEVAPANNPTDVKRANSEGIILLDEKTKLAQTYSFSGMLLMAETTEGASLVPKISTYVIDGMNIVLNKGDKQQSFIPIKSITQDRLVLENNRVFKKIDKQKYDELSKTILGLNLAVIIPIGKATLSVELPEGAFEQSEGTSLCSENAEGLVTTWVMENLTSKGSEDKHKKFDALFTLELKSGVWPAGDSDLSFEKVSFKFDQKGQAGKASLTLKDDVGSIGYSLKKSDESGCELILTKKSRHVSGSVICQGFESTPTSPGPTLNAKSVSGTFECNL